MFVKQKAKDKNDWNLEKRVVSRGTTDAYFVSRPQRALKFTGKGFHFYSTILESLWKILSSRVTKYAIYRFKDHRAQRLTNGFEGGKSQRKEIN